MIYDVFLDANVAVRAAILPLYPDHLIFGLAQYGCIRLVFCAHVLVEIERNLDRRWDAHHQGHPPPGPNRFRETFQLLYNLAHHRPDTPQTTQNQDALARRIIRHLNDVPVLAAAMRDVPGGIVLTNNSSDFTPAVARRSGLRIYTPARFLTDRVRAI